MKKGMLLFLLAYRSLMAFADVKLPAIFSSHMVIQRNKSVVIWGWATAAEKVEVSFKGQIYIERAAIHWYDDFRDKGHHRLCRHWQWVTYKG